MKRLLALCLLISTTTFAQDLPKILNRFTQTKDLMPSTGKYQGQTVENTQRRTLMFLSSAEKASFGISADVVAFANFRHNKEFYVAAIEGLKSNKNGRPASASPMIEKIILLKKHWAGKTRPETKEMEVHAELIFYFKKNFGVKLFYNQTANQKLKTPKLLANAVFSAEAVRSSKVQDAPFMPDALGPNFALAQRVISLYERDLQHQEDPERTLTSYRFDMSETKSKRSGMGPSEAILATALERSNDRGRKEAYHIVTNNCTSNQFDLLDTSVSYNKSKGGKIDYNLIKEDIVTFVNKDLESMMNFLQNMADKNQDVVDADTRELLQKYTVDHALTSAQDLDMTTVGSPDSLMYQVPAFIDGHLRARGLLK